MDRNVTFSVPADTAEDDPVVVVVKLGKGIIVKVRIGIPDGAADEVHVVIIRGGHQVWPSHRGENYAWNDTVHVIEASYLLEDHPLKMKIVAWNGDTVNAHQVTVGFNMLPLEPSRLGQFVQAMLGRPSRWR